MIDLAPDQYAQTVLQSEGSVLVYVSATWCGPCRALRPVVEQFASEHPDTKVVKVDLDTHRPLVINALGIKSVPTLIAYRDGKEVARHSGLASKEKLGELLTATTA